MAKFFKNLEGKVSELIDGIQKTYSDNDEKDIDPLSPEEQKKMKRAAEIFLIGSAAGTAALGAYTNDFPVKTTLYSITGFVIGSYLLTKLLSHYKMKKQCKSCRHEIKNVEKIFKEAGAEYGQSIGPCTLFKPKEMMLNCSQHKKYEEK